MFSHGKRNRKLTSTDFKRSLGHECANTRNLHPRWLQWQFLFRCSPDTETIVIGMCKCGWQRDGGHDRPRYQKAEMRNSWAARSVALETQSSVAWSNAKGTSQNTHLHMSQLFWSRAFYIFYLNTFCLFSYHTRYAICFGRRVAEEGLQTFKRLYSYTISVGSCLD